MNTPPDNWQGEWEGGVVVYRQDGTIPSDEELAHVLDELAVSYRQSPGTFHDCICELLGQDFDTTFHESNATSWHDENAQLNYASGVGRFLQYMLHVGDNIDIHVAEDLDVLIPISRFREAFTKAGLVVHIPDDLEKE